MWPQSWFTNILSTEKNKSSRLGYIVTTFRRHSTFNGCDSTLQAGDNLWVFDRSYHGKRLINYKLTRVPPSRLCFREGSGAFMWTPRRNLMAVNVMFPRNVHAAESFTLCIILLHLSTNRPVPSCDFHGILSPSFNPVDLPPAHQLHLHWLAIKHKHWHSQASVCSEAWCVFHNTGVLAHALGQD